MEDNELSPAVAAIREALRSLPTDEARSAAVRYVCQSCGGNESPEQHCTCSWDE